jgi:hypothetical protein
MAVGPDLEPAGLAWPAKSEPVAGELSSSCVPQCSSCSAGSRLPERETRLVRTSREVAVTSDAP